MAGDPADPRTVERRAIFEPLGLEIARQMEQIAGSPDPQAANRATGTARRSGRSGGEQADAVRAPAKASVAMLVFAPGATDAGRFEDYARCMYPEDPRCGLLTWTIGPASGPGPEDFGRHPPGLAGPEAVTAIDPSPVQSAPGPARC